MPAIATDAFAVQADNPVGTSPNGNPFNHIAASDGGVFITGTIGRQVFGADWGGFVAGFALDGTQRWRWDMPGQAYGLFGHGSTVTLQLSPNATPGSDFVTTGPLRKDLVEALEPSGAALAEVASDGAVSNLRGARRGTRFTATSGGRFEAFVFEQFTFAGQDYTSQDGDVAVVHYTADGSEDWAVATARETSAGTEMVLDLAAHEDGVVVAMQFPGRFALGGQDHGTSHRFATVIFEVASDGSVAWVQPIDGEAIRPGNLVVLEGGDVIWTRSSTLYRLAAASGDIVSQRQLPLGQHRLFTALHGDELLVMGTTLTESACNVPADGDTFDSLVVVGMDPARDMTIVRVTSLGTAMARASLELVAGTRADDESFLVIGEVGPGTVQLGSSTMQVEGDSDLFVARIVVPET